MDRVAWMIRALLFAVAFAAWWGPTVALSADFDDGYATGPRPYTYQNSGGVQTWAYGVGDGHAKYTYDGRAPAGGASSYGRYTFENDGTGALAKTHLPIPYAPGKSGTGGVADKIPLAGIKKAAAAAARMFGPAAAAAAGALAFCDMMAAVGYGPCADGGEEWTVYQPSKAPNPEGDGGAYYTTSAHLQSGICAGMDQCSLETSGNMQTCYRSRSWAPGYGRYFQYCGPKGMWPGEGYFGMRTAYLVPTCPEGFTYSSSVPAGCWRNAGQRPLTPTEVAALESQVIDGCPGGCGVQFAAGVMGDLVGPLGQSVEGIGPTVTFIPDTGPWPGDNQVTTHPDGSQTQTSSSYAPSANGDKIEVRKTTTVTEKDPQGQTTSVTTTEGGIGDETGEPDTADALCEAFPDVVACWTSGTIPAQEVVVEESHTLDFDPVAVAGSSSSCPAPIEAVFLGQSFSISWASVCQFASGIHPIVIALGWIAAAGIVFGSVRGGSA